MSFSQEVRNELKNKSFTSKKRHSKIQQSGYEDYKNRIIQAFIQHGSISDPEKSYLLEFLFENEMQARETAEVLSRLELRCRLTERKEYFVVYVKDAETISDILNLIGAHKCLLDFENTRIFKSMREDVQRKVNCETANLQKTVSASVRQIEDIEYIRDRIGFEHLQDSLVEVARLRINNPNATLQELSECLDPPVGKSGVNHRLRKLSKIAEELRKSNREVILHDQ